MNINNIFGMFISFIIGMPFGAIVYLIGDSLNTALALAGVGDAFLTSLIYLISIISWIFFGMIIPTKMGFGKDIEG